MKRKPINIEQNWFDKTIAYLSPNIALKRFEARTRLAIAGGYVGARYDRRQTKSWQVSDGSANNVTLPDLPILRQRSRDLLRNAPLAVGAINTVVTNVVGTGLKVQSRVDREILKNVFKKEEDFDFFERNAERIFNIWAQSKNCDITRCQTFNEIQSLILRSVLESGDIFIVKRYTKRASNIIDLALQIVEADRVSNPESKVDNENLVAGVEIDKDGAPVFYHICNQHPNDYETTSKEFVKISAFDKNDQRQVLHVYDKTRPGLSRGVPYLAPVIETLKQLDRYSEAEIMSAVVSAMFTVFVKSESDEGLGMNSNDSNSYSKKDDDYKLAPGAILELEPNENIEIADPKRPNQAFDPFVQAILRQVGVALEIPFEILIKHFTASYSAAQAALVEAWKFFSSKRKWLEVEFCQPVYELVITEAIAKDILKAPGFFANPIIKNAYLGTDWIGPPRGQIDQLKEVKAAQMRVETGITTLSEETAILTGGDFEKKYPQILKEFKLKQQAGIVSKEQASIITSQSNTQEKQKPKNQ